MTDAVGGEVQKRSTDRPEIEVEVVVAERNRQHLVTIRVPDGTTAAQAVRASRVLDGFAQAYRHPLDLGVFGRRVSEQQVLRDGDRVEIYRPLTLDPKEARKIRAAR